MFAIVQTGGKQYTVKPGDVLEVALLDAEPGKKITLDTVLAVSTDGTLTVGTPSVDKATVEAEVVEHGRAAKIYVFKRKRRKDYKRRQGHRQDFTKIKINDIKVG